MNAWQAWIDRVTDSESARQIGRKIGINHATVGRWMNAATAPCARVIQLARAYEADPIEGLIAAGHLTGPDLMHGGLRNAVRHAPTAYLTEELHSRVEAGKLDGAFDELRAMLKDWG